ncbi:hypothetical protein BSZ37_18520 [Rubrivirga marina]|uniref:Uncharacterized protein n=1 Tax=Rubrivirga marina TaxID=1196024 RepID=A0A271J5N2_9BACT|nr:hypothetical protein BSZ37_18520 [Rubrivirga marina]
MPRWIFLLSLIAVAVVGGVEAAWAVPAPTETHESTLPVEPPPASEEAEEENEAARLGGLAAVLPAARGPRPASEMGLSPDGGPPEPPPR